jgi:small subunit ribosomal protein S2
LKPGERKVISDGTDGPVVEIIRRSEPEADGEEAAEDVAEASDTEKTGE